LRVADVAEERLPIGVRLRFVLFGLECVLGVSFAGAERERVFRDAADDQVSAKRYTFFESPRLTVRGRVDEYEPESIWVRVVGGRGFGAMLRRVAEGAGHAEFRLHQSLVGQRPAEPVVAPDPPVLIGSGCASVTECGRAGELCRSAKEGARWA
jgi:hypothetical protein